MSRRFSPFKKDSKTSGKRAFLPNKTLGQNFLKDGNQIRRIIEASGVKKDDVVLEIGPGLGAITFGLASRAKKVIAVEKDKRVAEALKLALESQNIKNVEIPNKDILALFGGGKLDMGGLKEYKVVANIPYYLTSFLIRNLLEIKNRPEDIFLMIQYEVAKRICAKPPNMTLLSVSVGYYASPKILFKVSKNCFYPKPKVDSAFIQITPKGIEKNDGFFKIVKAGFSHPRKQLLNNLSSELKLNREEVLKKLEEAGLKPEQRAETLSLENWEKLFTYFHRKGKKA